MKHVANAFNTYFASIGKEMADALPDVQGFEDHLGLIQAKLWNKTAQKFDWDIDPIYFKKQVKTHYLSKYISPDKDVQTN